MTAHVTRSYTRIAQTFHWITAAMVLTMIPAGITMTLIGRGALQNWLFDFHRSMGVLIFVLVLARLAYRLTHPPAPLPSDLPQWQHKASKVVHIALYALLLINPLIGWIATSAYPAKISVFGMITLPAIVGANRPLSEQLFEVHKIVGITVAVLVVIHIAAALHHHFVRRDEVLLRMIR